MNSGRKQAGLLITQADNTSMPICMRTCKRTRNQVAATVVAIVMTTVIVMTMSEPSLRVHKYQLQRNDTFIPNYPNQTLVGRPAFIPHRFLIEEADACLRKGREVEVVVYVHSAISRVKQRQQTRLTWASSSALKMVVVFMVGRAKDDTEREIVRRESELYHDIVQGDYGDYYHLLSYKGLSSLYWITRNCAHVPWTLHADDDILIDTFLLKQFLQVQRDTSDESKLHCRTIRHAKVLRKGKWKVTQEEMDAKRYPTYCQGILWYINTRQLPNLLDASTSVNYLWVDDVYITGCLTREASIGLSDLVNTSVHVLSL
ncbi:Beta-1,3-galactosyltransferase 2 [Chionoecetes opilio]|uniref:Hexosyltransferase n=1 Tax=Chionoecetes opilio TaxID=41210 RepID=A0A8J4YEU5_CHIOP|nr:Beta-1,3-galactosyltransferase 2 [Chionoecetes opilio]